jgi:uncharacterized protein YegP (UPF0339 family)
MSAKFEIKKAADGSFYFHLKAANGEIILASQMYTAKSSAENGIESVKANALLDERYERKSDTDGKPFFVLKAANDQMIGKSQMYASAAKMEEGIISVKKNAQNAAIVDLASAG